MLKSMTTVAKMRVAESREPPSSAAHLGAASCFPASASLSPDPRYTVGAQRQPSRNIDSYTNAQPPIRLLPQKPFNSAHQGAARAARGCILVARAQREATRGADT
jgi:hypothetical protein